MGGLQNGSIGNSLISFVKNVFFGKHFLFVSNLNGGSVRAVCQFNGIIHNHGQDYKLYYAKNIHSMESIKLSVMFSVLWVD